VTSTTLPGFVSIQGVTSICGINIKINHHAQLCLQDLSDIKFKGSDTSTEIHKTSNDQPDTPGVEDVTTAKDGAHSTDSEESPKFPQDLVAKVRFVCIQMRNNKGLCRQSLLVSDRSFVVQNLHWDVQNIFGGSSASKMLYVV